MLSKLTKGALMVFAAGQIAVAACYVLAMFWMKG